MVGEVVALDPCVEADFADGGFRVLEEEGFEGGFPIWRAVGGLPWVDAEGWEEGGVLAAEGSDLRPVIRVGAIDDGGGDACGGQFAEEVVAPRVESAIVEVVVGVAPHGMGDQERAAASSRMREARAAMPLSLVGEIMRSKPRPAMMEVWWAAAAGGVQFW